MHSGPSAPHLAAKWGFPMTSICFLIAFIVLVYRKQLRVYLGAGAWALLLKATERGL